MTNSGLKATFVCAVLTVLFLITHLNQDYYHNLKRNNVKSRINPTTKVVLLWTTLLGNKDFYIERKGYDHFASCPVNDCYITNDKEFLPIEDYAALIFYVATSPPVKEVRELPYTRHPDQRYIFASYEVPIRFNDKYRSQYIYNSFYNWTMTYRFDSDISRRYGHVLNSSSTISLDHSLLQNKTRSVAWMVSNCYSKNKREELVRKLQKHIDVDVYGLCGNLTCKREKPGYCYDMIGEKYWFYLAFENSDCQDYTTEKFYNTLGRNIVPIVYGGGDYYDSKVAPPDSFINVKNYKTVESLAAYLKFLISNEETYLGYFKWKLRYSIDMSSNIAACNLCRKLHDPNEPRKTYDDIIYWWFNNSMAKCKTGEQLPKFI